MSSITTDEIPKQEWHEYFNDFSKRRRGWLATVEVLDPQLGDQIEADRLPLEGITYEHKAEPDTIEIMLGSSPEDHLTHVVASPRVVRIARIASEEGTDETLEIECKDESTILVRFHSGATASAEDTAQ